MILSEFNENFLVEIMSVNSDDTKFLFSVGKGNFPNQIIKQMEARGNWKLIPEDEAIENADFYWRPINLGPEGYSKMDKRLKAKPEIFFVFNHFEVIHGICTKTNLIKSLRTYYENNELAKAANYSIFDSTPTTYVMQSEGVGERDMLGF